jgi:hypothetical protein
MQQDLAKAEAIEMSYREAVRAALRDALGRDKRVFLMGEDVGRYGGCYASDRRTYDREFQPACARPDPQ